jgi:ribosomal protection tetracycline resistance protein
LVPLYIYKTADNFADYMGQYVRETLQQGLWGWEVTDCTVTMIDSGYGAPGTNAADFRKLTPLVLMSALQQAGTVICEPMHRFHIEIPSDTFGSLASALVRFSAVTYSPELRGDSYMLDGVMPAARVHELQQLLPSLTRGEGVLESVFDGYQPVEGGSIPTRARTDHNPLDRKEYLLHVLRRV